MEHSINRRPLLKAGSDSEFEDDLETEADDPQVSVPDEKPFFKPREPIDKYHIAYIVFYLLGMNTLIPWCFFINANDYWMYKFREIHSNNTGQHNYSHAEILEKKTDFQANFTSYLNVSSAIPNTLFLVVNTFISKRISLGTRMIGSQVVILILFVLTTSLVMANTDNWQNSFFVITLTTVAFVNAMSAIFGGSLMGIVGRFSPKYITAMSGGQALGGIFTALTEICALWIGASPVVSGLIYFIIGDFVLLVSLISYVILNRMAFFKHHMAEDKRIPIESNYSINTEVTFVEGRGVSYGRIFKRVWPYGLSIFLVFFITVAAYPAITVLVESENKGNGNKWNDIYFVPVIAYLIFSIGDYAGRLLSGLLLWPSEKPWKLIVLCLLRALLVPALMLCNAQPRRHIPVYITNDVYYALLTIVFSITNGYLCNISMILAPTVVNGQDKEIASAMMGAFLGFGLSAGSALSLILVRSL